MLNRAIREQVEQLRVQFAAALPFRHIVLEQFLEPEFCRRWGER